MEKTGLTLDEVAGRLSAAETIQRRMEKTKLAKSFAGNLYGVSREFAKAVHEKDFDRILKLEKIAQTFERIYANNEKELEAIEAVYKVEKDIEQAWENGKKEDVVREMYADLFGKKIEELTPAQRQDTGMKKHINAKLRHLTKFAVGTANQAEKDFFLARKAALVQLGIAHQKNIDRALGVEQKKAHDLDRNP